MCIRDRAYGDGLTTKLQKLLKKAGIEQLDMDGKFVAIKIDVYKRQAQQSPMHILRTRSAKAIAIKKNAPGK